MADKNNAFIGIRIPSDDKKALEKHAEKAGKSVSEIVRDAAMKETKKPS